MAIICPTITAENIQDYELQLTLLEGFAHRMHIDFMDGLFTNNHSISLDDATLPSNGRILVDLHLMYMRPDLYLEQMKRFKPNLVIVQAEAKSDFATLADNLHAEGVKVGVALLQNTAVENVAPAIHDIDHVLVFSGNLGHFGGEADLKLLSKVKELRNLKPDLEIAWDGGINDYNALELIQGGVDVLNVGGYIQRSDDPASAYDKLTSLLKVK